MNDFLTDKITKAIENNNDLILEASLKLDYTNQRIIWDKNKYYIKNIKVEHITKEIKEYINQKKKNFIRLSINNMSKNIEWFFINLPWDIIDVNRIGND